MFTGMQESWEEEQDKTEEKFSFALFCEEAVSLLLMAYLFVVFFIYPFYMQNGYMEIGSAKYNFYKYITLGAFCLIIPLAVCCIIFRFRETEKPTWYKTISFTDCAVLIYTAGVILSFCFSAFKQEALWGEKGWYMGLVTQLLFILSYFLVSRFWEYEEKILFAFMAAAAGVFLLGLLNRFSIYPIAVNGATNEFISTLGNINWYSGYWSVLFPIGLCMYWFTEKWWLRLIAALYTVLGIATGVSQGSNSAFIVIAGLYLFVFCLSFRSIGRMRRFFELSLLFCLTCQGLRIWRILLPESFDYYNGTLSDWITMSRITLYAIVPLAVVYLLLVLADKRKGMVIAVDIRRYKILRQITLLVLIITVGVYILLLVLNTRTEGGIRFMGSRPALIFSEYWGSSRGGTWLAGANIFHGMSAFEKTVGVGPDCFAYRLYIMPDVTEAVMDQFGTSRLTNAHNEWLTVLVNNGIIGFTGYAGIFISVVIRFIHRAERAAASSKEKFLYIFAASAFAYTIHNIVSFQQILSTPFIFLMIGMGERLMRETLQPRLPKIDINKT